MKLGSLSLLIVSVIISFAVGFSIAWNIQTPSLIGKIDIAAAPAAPAIQHPGAAAPFPASTNPDNHANADFSGPATFDELWARATASSDKQRPGDDAQDRLIKLAQSDKTVMRTMVQRYGTERNPNTKNFLKIVLSTLDKPELLDVSTKLINSGDASQRRDGFELMQQMPGDSAETRQVIQKALASEQSPEVLTQALTALQPATVAPAESAALVTQLQTLSQHVDPGVRSQSILQLAQWDKKGNAEDRYAKALSDQAPQVRQAAVVAIAQSGARSDTVKAALMSLLNNPSESKEVKASALQVLERFPLSKEEFAIFSSMREQLRGS